MGRVGTKGKGTAPVRGLVCALACGGGMAPRRYGLAWDLFYLLTVPLPFSLLFDGLPRLKSAVCGDAS